MNKKISAAVASAALVLGASSAANAGIIVPAGEWTLDFNGNVNAYASFYDADDANTASITGGLAGTQDSSGESDSYSIGTGLLPSWLGVQVQLVKMTWMCLSQFLSNQMHLTMVILVMAQLVLQ